jgi:hypothetical protein
MTENHPEPAALRTRTTPAETLRSAARLMRERATAASPGPWHQMCMGSEGCSVINDGRLRDRRHVSFSGRKEWKADHADAEYIAGMSPFVGAALADLFDRIAWMVEMDADLAERVGVDETLAVAVAYLGLDVAD